MVTNKIIDTLKKSLLTPLLALKKRYIPLLVIYFAYGMQAITGVALTFWEKENLSLSAESLLAVGIWVSLPFTIKMVFGQLVDVVPLFGSRRKAWIFVGALLMTCGYLLLYGMTKNLPYATWLGSQFNMYLTAQLLMVLGFVIQDVTADAMTTEVVDRNQDEEKVKADLSMVQVLGRLAMMLAFTISGGLGGYLAGIYTYDSVFILALCIPVISMIGTLFINLDVKKEIKDTLSPTIFGGGVLFAIFTVFMGFNDYAYSQEITFFVSLVLITAMLYSLLKDQDRAVIKAITLTFVAIFIFRASPSVGPGYSWWSIDVLGFDQSFMGTLRSVSGFSALIVLWFASDFIAKKSVRSVFIMLILFGTFLSLPDLLLYNGVHEKLGINARTIALLDTMSESPLAQLSMIPMLAMIAYYAPVGKSATWFAVSASLMNLATTGSSLITKYLNKIFIITREIKNKDGVITTAADYSQLGPLLWIVIIVSFVVPMLAVLFFLKDDKKLRA